MDPRDQQSQQPWQDALENVAARNAFLVGNSTLSDVMFICGKPEKPSKVPAHRLLLSLRSPVFEVMFSEKWGSEKEITITDIDPEAFVVFLRYLYTDQVVLTADTVVGVLYAAKKYEVPALLEKCRACLKSNPNPETALSILSQLDLIDEPTLFEQYLEFVLDHGGKAISPAGFSKLSQNLLNRLLDSDGVMIRETVLFRMVELWAEAECVRQNRPLDSGMKRQVLGETLHKIRFPSMTQEEFAQGPAESGLLSTEEVKELLLQFALKKPRNLPYSSIPRRSHTQFRLDRFQTVKWIWQCEVRNHRLTFSANRPIVLTGLQLYGIKTAQGMPAKEHVVVSVYPEGNEEPRVLFDDVVPQYDLDKILDAVVPAYDVDSNAFPVMFPEPLMLKASRKCTIKVKFPASCLYHGKSGQGCPKSLSSAFPDGSNVEFTFYNSIWSFGRNGIQHNDAFGDLCTCGKNTPALPRFSIGTDEDDLQAGNCKSRYSTVSSGQIPALYFCLAPG